MEPPTKGDLAFVLWLLSQMRAEPQTDAALAASGVDRKVMRASAEYLGQTLGLNRPGHAVDLYRQLLGPPIEAIPEPTVEPTSGFAGSIRHRFHLALWPDLDFLIRSHREGWAWGPELVRRPGGAAPSPRRIEEIAPWSMLETEVRARFGPFTAEYPLNHSNEAYYTAGDATSGPRAELCLLFDFGLVQSVGPAAD